MSSGELWSLVGLAGLLVLLILVAIRGWSR